MDLTTKERATRPSTEGWGLQTFQPPRINKKNPVSLAGVFSRLTLFPQLFSLFVTHNLDPGYRNPNNKLMLATSPTPPVIATHRSLQNAVKPLILKILPLNYLLSIFCENNDRSDRSNSSTVNSLRRGRQKKWVCSCIQPANQTNTHSDPDHNPFLSHAGKRDNEASRNRRIAFHFHSG